MIALRGLSAQLGEFALRDVTFEVSAGRFGVVIGPAGSGKTTLIETIAGVVPQTTGTVHLNGRDVSRLPLEQRGIGLVYQHAFLFPHLSVRENVAYGSVSPALVEQLMVQFELREFASRAVHTLSGGERQVAALARALACRPSILLLDEPFSALDPRRRASVRKQVRDLQRAWNITVLQVTHDFAEAGMLGDVLVLLNEGRVLQSGTPAEVFARPVSGYVAEFLGAENVFVGVARRIAPDAEIAGAMQRYEFSCGDLSFEAMGAIEDGSCTAVLRAEEVVVARAERESSMRNQFRGTVSELTSSGAQARVSVHVRNVQIVAALTWRSVETLELKVGDSVMVSFKAFAVHLC